MSLFLPLDPLWRMFIFGGKVAVHTKIIMISCSINIAHIFRTPSIDGIKVRAGVFHFHTHRIMLCAQ